MKSVGSTSAKAIGTEASTRARYGYIVLQQGNFILYQLPCRSPPNSSRNQRAPRLVIAATWNL